MCSRAGRLNRRSRVRSTLRAPITERVLWSPGAPTRALGAPSRRAHALEPGEPQPPCAPGEPGSPNQSLGAPTAGACSRPGSPNQEPGSPNQSPGTPTCDLAPEPRSPNRLACTLEPREPQRPSLRALEPGNCWPHSTAHVLQQRSHRNENPTYQN